MSGVGYPGRPHCRGYSYQPFRGKQVHAHPEMHPVERWTIAEKSRADVLMNDGEESGSGADSGWSGVSDNSTDSDGTILEASGL